MDNNDNKQANTNGSQNSSSGNELNGGNILNNGAALNENKISPEFNKSLEAAGGTNKNELSDFNQDVSARYRTKSQEVILIFIKFAGIFAVIFAISAFFVFGKKHVVNNAYTVVKKVNKVVNIMPTKDKYTFLLLGTDKLIDVNRTDSMILAYLSIIEKRIDIISIPRDMKVEIAGHGIQKINSVYTFEQIKTKSENAAVKKVTEKIEEITGGKIDYYVKVDLDGFEKIIDLFGGVEIDVEKNMTYDDNKQNLHIRLKKGVQVLSGKKSLEYCRFRHDRLGDIGRMQRQQKFLKALVNKFKDGKTIVRLPDIISGALRFVSTDIDMTLVMSLIAAVPEPSLIKTQTHTMPGDYGYVDNLCYFVGEIDKLKTLVKNIATGEIVKIEEQKEKEKEQKEKEKEEKIKKELEAKNNKEARNREEKNKAGAVSKETKVKEKEVKNKEIKIKEEKPKNEKPAEENKKSKTEVDKTKLKEVKVVKSVATTKAPEKKKSNEPQNVVIEVKPQEEPAAVEPAAVNAQPESSLKENKIIEADTAGAKKKSEISESKTDAPVLIKEDKQ